MFRNISMSLEFSADAQKKIAALCERYPSKQPVVLAALHLAQKEVGHLSDDALKLVARTLDLPYAHVYGVATFYTMFRHEPGGLNTIRVCTNISCMLNGSDEVVAYIEKKLGIRTGESTPDGRIFLKREEECLAACTGAPMMMVDHVFHEYLTPEKIDGVLDELK